MTNWYEEVLARTKELLDDLFDLLRIESVKDESTRTEERPMGQEIGKALDFVLKISENRGFNFKNVDGYAEYGNHESSETIGILCHVDVVPENGEWASPPFEPTIWDGKIFA